MKRRDFLINSAAATTGLSLLGVNYSTVGQNASSEYGIQLYTMAKVLSDDFIGTIKMLAEVGYKNLEFAGPYYYSPKEEIENNILIQQMGLKGYGYYDHSPKELRKFLDELGLKSKSAHVSILSLDNNINEAINAANIIGHEYLICPMLVGSTIDEYKSAADKFNKFGEACKKAGIRYGYHTHSLEFGDYEGETPFDVLIKRTDPDLVFFELDLFWTKVAGVDPVELIKNNPNRIKLVHIKDMAEKMEAPDTDWETFTNSEKALAIISNQSIIGEGIINFKKILNGIKDAGIEYYIIESDFPPDPVNFAKKSIQNISNIR
jgi:sugar phosphate isomerase/epimerase